MSKRKITDQNLYELLGILSSATDKEIKSAYRTKALKVHPDKNPDNPKAVELFHELSEAIEILSDPKAREAYDKTLKAKELAKERTRELDSKRRKLKEDLERREKEAKEKAVKKGIYKADISDEQKLQNEITRLRKEGSKILQEEQELLRSQILKEQKDRLINLSQFQPGPGSQLRNQQNTPPPSSQPSISTKSFEDFEAMVLKNLQKAAAAQKKEQEEEGSQESTLPLDEKT